MASSSSSSSSSSSVTTKTSFDVFLSFRGADTRDNFTSHLYGALCREKIQTFIDDNLNRGEEIEPSLMQVIEESEISVVIFSKGYASSPWCLDELMKILECRKTMQRMVLPVFYHVDPSDVEEPSGDFGDAFQKLEEKYKTSMPNWRFALKEATTLSGWDSKNHRPDSTLVEVVVKDVKDILSKMHQMSSTDSGGFVGIESHIEKIESLLSIGPEAVRFVGVWGMGGIGKSTCAELVYHRISNKFDGTCFLANVRENFEKEKDDPIPLLEKVISRILKDEKVKIETPNMLPESIKRRLQRMKVLIVLDDVNEARQMEYLVGNGNWFASGSRIIITSRDEHVLKHKVNELRLYRVGGLSEVDALQLFSLNAFEQKYPLLDYLNLSKRAIRYANGLPLALKVLGSHLCKRSKEQWELALENLPKSRDVQKNILGILEISYEELEKSQKDIFLDIACFFKGEEKDRVESILNGCGLNASWGITRLVEKCLVDIVNNKLQMHDLIQEMGRNIGKRNLSRIYWESSPEELLNIFAANEGNKTIEGIFLDFCRFRGNVNETFPQAFSAMDNLRILRTFNYYLYNFQCDIQCLPNRLSFLDWKYYPWESLPSNFTGENLVELNMSRSRLERLWNGNECPQKLKRLNLSYSEHLKRLPNLPAATNLEYINLNGCHSLVEIPSSIQYLHNLNELILSGCVELQTVPSLVHLESLENLDISGCLNLKSPPAVPRGIKILRLDDCRFGLEVQEWSASLELLDNLQELSMIRCENLFSLPSLVRLESLRHLNLSGCSGLKMLPDIPRGIENLHLDSTGLAEWSPSILFLNNLKMLSTAYCMDLRSLPSKIELNSIEKLNLAGCRNLNKFPEINAISLQILILVWSTIEELPSSIGCLSSLVHLDLRGCRMLESLPNSICELSSLKELILDASGIKELPSSIGCLSSLVELNLRRCKMLESLPNNICELSSLKELILDASGIKELPSSIGCLSSLVKLNLRGCKMLESLPNSICELSSLKELILNDTGIEELPSSIGCLSSLVKLDLRGCKMLESLPNSICELSSLKELILNDTGIEELPSSIGCLSSLVKLNLRGCKMLESLPNSICELSSLKELILNDTGIQELPSSIGCLSSLIALNLRGCKMLESLPNNICELNSLKELNLDESGIEELPSSIGCLSSLIALNLRGCKMLESLPNSICELSSLKELNLDSSAIITIPSDIVSSSSLKELSLNNCKGLQGLPKLPEGLRELFAKNCLSLKTVERSLFNIVERSMLRIQIDIERFLLADYTRVVFPGSEVPEQFQCQSAGSSISIKLSPHYNNKAVGFAICAVGGKVPTLKDRITCDCHVQYDNCNRRKVTYYVSDMCGTESDHVFICNDRNRMSLLNVNKLSFKFGCAMGKSKIKMCGVHMTSIAHSGYQFAQFRSDISAINEDEEGEEFLIDYDPSSNAPVISKINREIGEEEGNEKDAAIVPSSSSFAKIKCLSCVKSEWIQHQQ
ncbi:disease resistance protein RUN1-like isoform X2 [Ricinus communis]|uniref:disease resistance protein RUN1-like isoform X2 n=1 Tax=Ricinus communis TaxID=3988 RepID=UPI00201B25D2|nr:disease resistance protein RUN1-like isoform X2 [Ricinus communis]